MIRRRAWDLSDPTQLQACVQACRDGDNAGLRTVFRHCEDQVKAAVVRRMLAHRRHHHEDAIQLSLAEAARAFPTFRGDSSPCTWMVTIASRVAVKERTRLEREGPPLPTNERDLPHDHRYQPEQHLEAAATADEIRQRLFSEFDEATREVLVRRYIEKQPVKTIASEMYLSVRWVEKRITDIKRFYRDEFEGGAS